MLRAAGWSEAGEVAIGVIGVADDTAIGQSLLSEAAGQIIIDSAR